MVLSMARPGKHPKTGVYWFRKAVPADLRPIIRKQEELRFLRTKDPAVARQRHADVAAEVERAWKALRSAPQTLTNRENNALAGLLYKELTTNLADEPGPPEVWEHSIRLNKAARQAGKLEQWLGSLVDDLLFRQGPNVDKGSRARLIEAVDIATIQADEQLLRNARGDYRPDPDADRFPEWTPPRPNGEETPKSTNARGARGVALTSLVEGWWRKAKAAGRSVSTVVGGVVLSLREVSTTHVIECVNLLRLLGERLWCCQLYRVEARPKAILVPEPCPGRCQGRSLPKLLRQSIRRFSSDN